MEFKKCARCGAIYLSDDNVCFNCKPKEKQEFAKFNTYIESVENISSAEEIAINTGISIKNVTRYLGESPIIDSFKNDNIGNISINL